MNNVLCEIYWMRNYNFLWKPYLQLKIILVSFHSDKSDLESQKGTNGRHQYCGTDPGRGRTGVRGGEVGARPSRLPTSSIPPDALYTAPRSSNTVSSKPDHEYENLKVRPGQAMGMMETSQGSKSIGIREGEVQVGESSST